MTRRKPPGISQESWVDRLIREARERGEFDHLPGEGKPLEDLGDSRDPLWWIKKWLRREGVSILPPELELRRKLERELGAVPKLSSEEEVRAKVAELNETIKRHNSTVTSGPMTRLGLLDAEEVLEQWRRKRQEGGKR